MPSRRSSGFGVAVGAGFFMAQDRLHFAPDAAHVVVISRRRAVYGDVDGAVQAVFDDQIVGDFLGVVDAHGGVI